MKKKIQKKPCIECGALVPKIESYPYKAHKDNCFLAKHWIDIAKANSAPSWHVLRKLDRQLTREINKSSEPNYSLGVEFARRLIRAELKNNKKTEGY